MDVIEATGRISLGRTFVQLKEGKTHLSLFCTLLFSLHIYNCVVQPLSPALAALGFFLSSKKKWSNHWSQHPKTSRQTPNQGTFPKKQAIHLIEKNMTPQPVPLPSSLRMTPRPAFHTLMSYKARNRPDAGNADAGNAESKESSSSESDEWDMPVKRERQNVATGGDWNWRISIPT